MRVLHANPASLDAPDAPGGRPEQEYVARHTLDREILVERADRRAFRFGDHEILSGVGNGAAGGDGRQASAPAAAHAVVHTVAMQIRAAAAPAGGDAFRENFEDGVEIAAR